ncbi:ribose transport system permease protein/inositol transport system permease protein [Anaerobacterium chartisolvens]|uniref:Ribose transport system permease protein/inositol transport system permease protein n=1 Tax=Anaerobacterium chartisolvens TaxID=1297424 RepID=A0A369BGG0_9FIRM|nr:ABC transporter permease [Anaerobacterium chartisolvens]RCX18774.1 ribose transport system permease protein/inositol transport system permease protein [Anaerobacterium chartisolvens]
MFGFKNNSALNSDGAAALMKEPGESFKSYMRSYALLVVFLVMVIVLSIISPTFMTPKNIVNIFRQISINGILAVGMTFVIILGGIDLSIGSLCAIAGVTSAIMLERIPGISFVAIIAGVLACSFLGAVVGFIVSKFKIAPFIATLAMLTIARGLALVIAEGVPHTIKDPFYISLGNGYLWETSSPDQISIPTPVLIFVIVAAVSMIILYRTKFGRYVYAVGGNEQASRASGINVNKVKMMVFILNGTLCGIAGIVLAGRITSGQPSAATGYELDAIAAVIIGGASLTGGAGKISGTILGALIIGVLNNGLVLMGVSSYYQQIIRGVIIAAAVILDQRTKHIE